MDDVAEGSLYRIAQGVEDPEGAARQALEEMEAKTPPPDVVDEIHITRWDNGNLSVTLDRGETGRTTTVPTPERAMWQAYAMLKDMLDDGPQPERPDNPPKPDDPKDFDVA